ncbi:unnamed protein product [Larinioides sclopetarius]|uniref:glutathione transferase n=1 Tax=Larinioides sclopetarius TaxID=280406 RepID=A0AAV1ZTJ8_9ARAC
MSKPTIGYWDIRGLAEPIRYLLHYNKVDFVDKRYAFDKDDWIKEKFTLGLDFPNLPYYIEGDIKLTQSNAILRHLARKYGLDGKDDQQKLSVTLVEQQMTDLHYALVLPVYRDDYGPKVKAAFIENIPNLLTPWEKYLGDKKYLTGNSITYVDFMAYDVFDFYRLFHKEALADFPKIRAYQERMKSLPELQEYMSSTTYQNRRWPIFGATAKDCGGGEPPEHL